MLTDKTRQKWKLPPSYISFAGTKPYWATGNPHHLLPQFSKQCKIFILFQPFAGITHLVSPGARGTDTELFVVLDWEGMNKWFQCRNKGIHTQNKWDLIEVAVTPQAVFWPLHNSGWEVGWWDVPFVKTRTGSGNIQRSTSNSGCSVHSRDATYCSPNIRASAAILPPPLQSSKTL